MCINVAEKYRIMKYIIRIAGEVVTKSDKVRSLFINQLAMNLRTAFQKNSVEAKVVKSWTRVFVETSDNRATDIISTIFGVQNFSPVDFECETSLDEMADQAFEYYKDSVEGKSFAVKSKRSGKIGFSSMDFNMALGSRLNSVESATVNLGNPDVRVQCEMSKDGTSFFHKVIKGAGGLPLGTQERAIVLMSGGFDSPVAAWMLQKRGVRVDYVFCNVAGGSYERSVLEISKYLFDRWGSGSKSRFYSLDFEKVVKNLKENGQPKYVQVILKRLFYRAAEKIAKQTGAAVIITGEAIGQVSSQTLSNLVAIEDSIELPVLRPIVATDKNDIIAISRDIGTYEFSAKVNEYCQLMSEKPSTACTVKTARAEEEKLDASLLEESINGAKMLELKHINFADLAEDYVLTNKIDEDAIVVDIRDEEQFEIWHYPNAVNIEAFEIFENLKVLDKSKKYVLYCPVGMQSAVAAEKLQSSGYDVYSFEGGVGPLQKYEKANK